MNASALDTITTAFVSALQAGQLALQPYALPLLAVFALIAFYFTLGPLVANSGAGLGDALGTVLLTTIRIGIFYWILVNLIPLTNAAFLTFVGWGLAPTGGAISPESFKLPSLVVDLGFKAAYPLQVFIQSFAGWSALKNLPTIIVYVLSYWIIVLAFAFVGLHLMMTIIEFYMAALLGTVLIPFGILQPTAFFTEFSIGWITGGLVRIRRDGDDCRHCLSLVSRGPYQYHARRRPHLLQCHHHCTDEWRLCHFGLGDSWPRGRHCRTRCVPRHPRRHGTCRGSRGRARGPTCHNGDSWRLQYVEEVTVDTTGFTPQIGSENGHDLTGAPPEDWERLDQAYRELQRRDSSAEYRAWRAERRTMVLFCLIPILVAIIVWLALDHRKVQAFVQVVQQDKEGQLVQIGVPLDLLAYTPQEGMWMDMLSQWVRYVHWRGEDITMTRANWAWVYRHTCQGARKHLMEIEDRTKPFQVSKKRTWVDVRSVTKTAVPASYHVQWDEKTTDRTLPQLQTTTHTGAFSVGRYRPPTLADALDNRLGLCITGFDLSPTNTTP